MKNPYENQQDEVEVRLGRGAAWAFVFVFLLLITLPPLYRNLFELAKPASAERWVPALEFFVPQSGGGLLAHLQAFEGTLEDADFTGPPRRTVQSALTRGPLREGNRKTRIGKDGWLYFQTALDALTGYGPLRPEPDSVAKDPRRAPWRSPLDAITTFAGQLEDLGVELLLVPLPVKPMIYPEHLAGRVPDRPLVHPDAGEFYEKLEALPNVEVYDLAEHFWHIKNHEQVFLKQDTHWTPGGMEAAAHEIGEWLMRKDWFERDTSVEIKAGSFEKREALGDLVEKLDIGTAGFSPEEVEVRTVPEGTRDASSPIVLLGDSFTNIYSDDVGLTWGADAGFAEHLALRLGTPLDVIAINGGGATEVRDALARRKGSATLMKEKKVVVWAIAARDLFLSESAAREAEVEWGDVEFDTREPDPVAAAGDEIEPAVVRAKLTFKSEIPDPQSTTYKSLLYGVEYELAEVVSGEIEPEDGKIAVLHWAFKDRVLQPSAGYELGGERSLRLVPFGTQKKLKTLEQRYDGDLFDLYWDLGEGAEDGDGSKDEDGAARAASMAAPHLIASTGCVAFAILLGFGLRRRARHEG